MHARETVDCTVCVFIAIEDLETSQVHSDDLSLLNVVQDRWETL